ncbi:MAG: winged helix-turn-helix domain-containing protein, partial [Bryobacteraceae bacterium]
MLAGSGGRLLTRQELMSALWSDAIVEEGNLTFQISALRKALGEDGWIENVPKHGYRFNAPVQRETAAVAPLRAQAVPTRPTLKVWPMGAIAVAAAALYWVSGSNTDRPASGAIFQPVRITSYVGFEEWPDLSPDGSQVAFAWDGPSGGNYDIYVKLTGPGEPIRLTDAPGRDVSPVWSPDGRWLAFVRFAPAAGPVRILGLEEAGVYVKPALGGAERQVHELWMAFPHAESPRKLLAWTPDGKWIVAGGARRLDRRLRGLWLLPASGGEPRGLTTVPKGFLGDSSPAFSPDGQCLAFMRVQGSGADVYALPMKGYTPDGQVRRITPQS